VNFEKSLFASFTSVFSISVRAISICGSAGLAEFRESTAGFSEQDPKQIATMIITSQRQPFRRRRDSVGSLSLVFPNSSAPADHFFKIAVTASKWDCGTGCLPKIM
jgi:hypothetical protein